MHKWVGEKRTGDLLSECLNLPLPFYFFISFCFPRKCRRHLHDFLPVAKKNIAKYYNIAARNYYVLFSLRKWKRSSVIFIDVSFRHFVELYNVELTFIFQNILWIIQFYKKKSIILAGWGLFLLIIFWLLFSPLGIIDKLSIQWENYRKTIKLWIYVCMVTNSRVWILITRKKCLRR